MTLDTNAVVQHFFRRRPPTVVDYWIRYGWYSLVCSALVLEEYERKLLDQRVRRSAARKGVRWTIEDVQDFCNLCKAAAEIVAIPHLPDVTLEGPDAAVLATALVGRVEALVTWDPDFRQDPAAMRLLREHGIQLLDTDEFMRWLRKLREV